MKNKIISLFDRVKKDEIGLYCDEKTSNFISFQNKKKNVDEAIFIFLTDENRHKIIKFLEEEV